MNKVTQIHKQDVLRRFGPVVAATALCAALTMPASGLHRLGNDDDGPAADGASVEINAAELVSITVQQTDLDKVLQMLSIQSKRNIITSKGVSGSVTANLYNVTFYEALDSILRANGYRYIEDGNFIYVHTKAEYEELMAAMRATESRIFTVEYLSAVDAYEFIVPLLSEDGQAAYRGNVAPGMKPDLADGGADSYAFDVKLVVNDYPENLDSIADLLGELDTPPQQVLVEAAVLQTALSENNAFGIDFSLVGSINFSDLTSPLSVVNNLLAGNDVNTGFQPPDNQAFGLQSTPGNTAGPGTLKIGIMQDDIAVFLRLLDAVTDTTVLARPKILALNRQRAEVLVGAQVGYLQTTTTQTTSTQSVEFLDTGIALVFRPFISQNGMIRMELAPSISEAQLRNVTDANGQTITIPDKNTNQLTTNVRVRDGETLVLGGLFKESIISTRTQVPVLGDIPFIGAAFRGHDDQLRRDEIIFLLTPNIVQDERLFAMGPELAAYQDYALVGAREGLLPFSRDKQTDSYNRQAIASFAEGNSEKALYHVNNSLRLNPNQPHMIKFRERITGQKAQAHERSVMHRAIHREFGEMEARFDDSVEPDFMARAMRQRLDRGSQSQQQGATTSTKSESTTSAKVSSTDSVSTSDVSVAEAASDSATADQRGNLSEASRTVDLFAEGAVDGFEQDANGLVLYNPADMFTDEELMFFNTLTAEERSTYEQFLQEFYTALGLPGYRSSWGFRWSHIEPDAPTDQVPFSRSQDSVEVVGADSSFPD